MIDIRFLRENPEVVKQNIRNKFQDDKLPLVDEVIALDEELRLNKKRADDLRANRNKLSKSIGALMGQKKLEEAEAVKKEVAKQAEAPEILLNSFFTLLDFLDLEGISSYKIMSSAKGNSFTSFPIWMSFIQ